MKAMKPIQSHQLHKALNALKAAILEGANWRYEHLVNMAVDAGATDDDIDTAAHDAIQTLFAQAEQPVTPRQLAHLWH